MKKYWQQSTGDGMVIQCFGISKHGISSEFQNLNYIRHSYMISIEDFNEPDSKTTDDLYFPIVEEEVSIDVCELTRDGLRYYFITYNPPINSNILSPRIREYIEQAYGKIVPIPESQFDVEINVKNLFYTDKFDITECSSSE